MLSEVKRSLRNMSRGYKFAFGAVIGLFLAGILFALLSTVFLQSPLSGWILSGMTFAGIILAAVCYLAEREGYASYWFDFVFGFGVGLVIVAFFGTMSGTLTVPF